MKKLLVLFLFIFGVYYAYDKYEVEIKNWLEPSTSSEDTKDESIRQEPDPPSQETVETTTIKETRVEDQLFAVMGKKIIEEERYIAKTETNAVGRPVAKINPTIYILHCFGRETRKSRFFIVDLERYDNTRPKDKLTKQDLSKFESFLSEEKLREKVDQRRAQAKLSS